MKFSALNVDIDGSSLDFLDLRKHAHKGLKKRYPRKSRYIAIVSQSFVKTVADRHGNVNTCLLHAWCFSCNKNPVKCNIFLYESRMKFNKFYKCPIKVCSEATIWTKFWTCYNKYLFAVGKS